MMVHIMPTMLANAQITVLDAATVGAIDHIDMALVRRGIGGAVNLITRAIKVSAIHMKPLAAATRTRYLAGGCNLIRPCDASVIVDAWIKH